METFGFILAALTQIWLTALKMLVEFRDQQVEVFQVSLLQMVTYMLPIQMTQAIL
jgi:hypothetical protein